MFTVSEPVGAFRVRFSGIPSGWIYQVRGSPAFIQRPDNGFRVVQGSGHNDYKFIYDFWGNQIHCDSFTYTNLVVYYCLGGGLSPKFSPLMLDMLWGYLTPGQRELLEAVSVYRVPVVFAAAAAQGGVEENRDDRLRLQDLSLLSYLKPAGVSSALYYVHRLTAGYVLERMPVEKQKQAHALAAEYFLSIVYEGNKRDIADLIEARHHYLRAEEWDKAADATFDLKNYLTLHGFPFTVFRGGPWYC